MAFDRPINGVETAAAPAICRYARNLSDCRPPLDGLLNVLPGAGEMAMINAMNHSEPLAS